MEIKNKHEIDFFLRNDMSSIYHPNAHKSIITLLVTCALYTSLGIRNDTLPNVNCDFTNFSKLQMHNHLMYELNLSGYSIYRL